jgi:hypothetical protein
MSVVSATIHIAALEAFFASVDTAKLGTVQGLWEKHGPHIWRVLDVRYGSQTVRPTGTGRAIQCLLLVIYFIWLTGAGGVVPVSVPVVSGPASRARAGRREALQCQCHWQCQWVRVPSPPVLLFIYWALAGCPWKLGPNSSGRSTPGSGWRRGHCALGGHSTSVAVASGPFVAANFLGIPDSSRAY